MLQNFSALLPITQHLLFNSGICSSEFLMLKFLWYCCAKFSKHFTELNLRRRKFWKPGSLVFFEPKMDVKVLSNIRHHAQQFFWLSAMADIPPYGCHFCHYLSCMTGFWISAMTRHLQLTTMAHSGGQGRSQWGDTQVLSHPQLLSFSYVGLQKKKFYSLFLFQVCEFTLGTLVCQLFSHPHLFSSSLQSVSLFYHGALCLNFHYLFSLLFYFCNRSQPIFLFLPYFIYWL